MARQQSSSELAGSLAATLTPRVAATSTRLSRASQDSGLFDVRALYAETLDEVMRRTRSDARRVSLARAGQPTRPPTTAWSPPARAFAPAVAAPFAFTRPPEVLRSRGLGWFGVVVAWLATVTLGASIATTLPGHALTRLRLGPSSTTATTSPQVPPLATVAPPVSAVAAVSPAMVNPPPLVAPAASPAFSAAPSAWAAPARAIASQPDAAHVSPKKLPPKGVAQVAHARPAAPVASTSAAPATSAIAAAPRAPAPSRPASVTAPTATNVSTAGMSLDELIRHEVQVESAKHR
jgi:hypothetical protein